MNWADKVAITTIAIAAIILMAAIRLALRFGGI
jgi:hypothetical protein